MAVPSSNRPTPTVAAIDAMLAAWDRDLSLVRENLDDLQDQPTYVMVSRGLTLEGVTLARVDPALKTIDEMAIQRVTLDGVVAQAQTLRASLNRLFPSEKTLREIDALLNGVSITLSPAITPLARRGLLDAASKQITLSPRDLLDTMAAAFGPARDAILELDAAWERVRPALDLAEQQLNRLAARAADLGADAQSELAAVRSEIASLRGRVLGDPMGVQSGFEQGAQRRLQALATRLDALAKERDGALQRLQQAQARQERAERAGHRLDQGQVLGLAEWLANIAETCRSGRYQAAQVGLGRWEQAAAPIYGPEDERQSLRDLLTALRAKAQSLRDRGLMVDAALDALAQDAEAALTGIPPNLSQARGALDRYRSGLATAR